MKVVNCIHCGTANIIQEGGTGEPEKCTKCGEYVTVSATLLGLMPTWLIVVFDIVGFLLLFGIPLYFAIRS